MRSLKCLHLKLFHLHCWRISKDGKSFFLKKNLFLFFLNESDVTCYYFSSHMEACLDVVTAS